MQVVLKHEGIYIVKEIDMFVQLICYKIQMIKKLNYKNQKIKLSSKQSKSNKSAY